MVVVIPARYGSTRFPGKPLADLCGKPLVQWAWEAARKSRRASRVIVATDDRRIARAVEAFGGEAVMTKRSHPSGTDRMAEVARKVKADVYVNVQGDEPLLDPRAIDALVAGMKGAPMATLAHPVQSELEWCSLDVVKVVTDASGHALYFSRAPIPVMRQFNPRVRLWRHVGIYAFTAAALRQFVSWPPGMLERAESLEQLRALERGMKIRVLPVRFRAHGVDTPRDLAHVGKLLKKRLKGGRRR